ncbi:restriction endonuclease subunit S [Vibrio sp. 10N.261.51.A3]|uniref:restriction endonuclease subunit S n=1 Tax=Vibrio sp. 10N.261.51.A3 TaxID=3229673 RepID=UPI00354D9E79
MSELPKGWIETTLGNVAKWSSGGTPSRKNTAYYNGDVPWVKTGDLGVRYLEEASESISNEGLKNSSAKLFPKNSVAIAMYGATIGKTSILNIEAATNQACGVAIPNASLSSIFLYYLLKNEKEGFIARGKGGAQPNISQTIIKEYSIWLPPLNEQIRITNKLDSILAKVDKAQARLDKIPAILKRFRQSVLAAATSGELTKEWRAIKEIDFEEWTKTKLSEVATSLDPNPSHRYPKSANSGVPILSTQQFVGESGWTTDKAKLVNREFYEERKEKTGFFENDIIFARKGRLGLARFAPTNMEFVFSHTVFIVRVSEKVQSNYLLWYLRDEQSLEWLVKEMNSNTGVPTLGKGVFEKLPINLPCEEEQSEIVSRIERLFSRANKIEKQYLDAKARLDRLTQSILAKAFRGELVPQDPNDEPAEQLLERILKEREQVAPKKTTRKRTTKAKTAEKG